MQINLDPTRWMVSFVGFVVDWMLTREWKRIALNSIPLMLLAVVGALVFVGNRLDKHKLADHYLTLGEKEIADWEQSWAPSTHADDSPEKSAPADKEKKELSRFAEVLFRRVELLEPNDRSRFIIAITMAQRGATAQAEKMLSKIAPGNRPGYAPAHAWIAQNMLQQPVTQENIRQVSHHVKEAAKWDRVPESLLIIGSELFWRIGEANDCFSLLKKAAEVNPANGLFLAQRSMEKNPVLAENSLAQAESYFRQKLQQDPHDVKSRIGLTRTILAQIKSTDDAQSKFAEAEELIRAGIQLEALPALTRELSDVYVARFRASKKLNGSTWSADLQMLDTALRIDPTNANAVEEIAFLARYNGESPGDELIQKLQEFLAEGKATVVTHAWISELYLIRKNYKAALPYLEQVVSRSPTTARYLNNLAFVIDEIAPARRAEALDFATRAVQLGNAQSDPSTADYYDTQAKVLVGLDRRTDAITALESAIERQPKRPDFHASIAPLYEAAGNSQMAEQHRLKIQRLNEEAQAATALAEAEAARVKAAEKAANVDLSPAPTVPATLTPAPTAPATEESSEVAKLAEEDSDSKGRSSSSAETDE